MSAPQEVLREYLLALNFKVDATQTRKFENTLTGIGVKANLLSSAIKGVAGTIATMAEDYVKSLDKMYYASRHLNSPIGQLEALSFAGKQVGLNFTAGIEAINQALLGNPATAAFISMLLHRPLTSKDTPASLFPQVVEAISHEKDRFTMLKDAQMLGMGNEIFDYIRELKKAKDAT